MSYKDINQNDLNELEYVPLTDNEMRLEIVDYLMNDNMDAKLNIIKSLINYIRKKAHNLIYESNRLELKDVKSDLIMAGIESIDKAIERFNHDMDNKFSTYAIYYINKYMLDEVYDGLNVYIVEIIRKALKEDIHRNSSSIDIYKFCKKHGYSISAFKYAMNSNNNINYIDSDIYSIDGSNTLYDYNIDEAEDNVFGEEFKNILKEILNEQDYEMIEYLYISNKENDIASYAIRESLTKQGAYWRLNKAFDILKKSDKINDIKDLFF